MGRRTGCKYDLVSTEELEEASERNAAPGGILPHEFVEILKNAEVMVAILNRINKNRKRHLNADDVSELIERLAWRQKEGDTE